MYYNLVPRSNKVENLLYVDVLWYGATEKFKFKIHLLNLGVMKVKTSTGSEEPSTVKNRQETQWGIFFSKAM